MKISVALCTYNGESFLREQLDSILSQTFPIQEIVVCDDFSTDTTNEILEEYQIKFPEIFRIHTNAKTLKSVKNFEKAISLCSGDIVFLSDQDDVWLPEKVETILNYFNENPDIDALATNGFAIDENSNFLSNHFTSWDVFGKFLTENPKYTFFNFITQKGNFATGATMAFRRNIIKNIIPFPSNIKKYHHDEWIATYVSANEKFGYINKKLIKYRIHESQQEGGIAFENGEIYKTIYNYFSFNTFKEDFISLRNRLKQQVNWHNKFLINFDVNTSFAYQTIQDKFFVEFLKNKRKFLIKFPFRSRLLIISDKILGKRQLKNN